MALIGKKSYVSYLQPVHLATEEPFEELQDMRLQEAILYAECMLEQLNFGEIVEMEWKLQTKKGELFTFRFNIGQLEESLPLMEIIEEGVRNSLNEDDANRVLSILPLRYEAKEKEYVNPRQWVLENEENFYFMRSEQAYIDHTYADESKPFVETLPDVYLEEPTEEIMEENEEIEEDNSYYEVDNDEDFNLSLEEIHTSDEQPFNKDIVNVNTDGLYKHFSGLDEKLNHIFSTYLSNADVSNIFEKHKKKAEQNEVQKSINIIKKKMMEKEIQMEHHFFEEKEILQSGEEEKQKLEEQHKEEELNKLDEVYTEKISRKKEEVANEKALEKEQALEIEKQKYQQAALEIEKKYTNTLHDLTAKALEKLEKELQEKKNQVISNYSYQMTQKNKEAIQNVAMVMQQKNNSNHTELQKYLYSLAEEEKERIDKIIQELHPVLDESAKHELEEIKLRYESESDEKYVNMERELRMKKMEQDKELEERKQLANEKQTVEQMKHEIQRSKEEYNNAIQLVEQMSKWMVPGDRKNVSDLKEKNNSILKTVILSFTAILCATVLGLGILFGLKYMSENKDTAVAKEQIAAQVQPEKVTYSEENPSLDALLNQKEFIKAAQLYPDSRNQIESTIFELKDVSALKRFNEVFKTSYGALDEAILSQDFNKQIQFYEENPTLNYTSKQLETIGNSYANTNKLQEAKEIQKTINSEKLEKTIQEKSMSEES
ncbi:hypothetical protein JGH54_002932 [Listeria monocytogenes]|nr:hypothetical protein [Listeria monocytogenes]EGW0547646.1 hypothetical protein [Listeria monocytogenes]